MAANVVSQARGKKQSQSSSGAVWENVKSLAGAVLIYLVIKTFLFEAYRIPSGSMVPTLLDRAAVQAAFEAVGGAEACLQMGVAYTMERQMFGRPLAETGAGAPAA